MGLKLFDFDGTLADSMPFWSMIDRQLFDEYGVEYTRELIQTLIPLTEWDTAAAFRRLGVQLTEEEIIQRKNVFMEDAYLNKIPLKPYALELVKYYKSKGETVAICSSTAKELLVGCVTRLGIADLFTEIFSASEFGYSKSNPLLYQKISEKMGYRPDEIQFFDDNVEALRAAASVGIHTVGVYDEGSDFMEEQIRTVAERYIHSFQEMLGE